MLLTKFGAQSNSPKIGYLMSALTQNRPIDVYQALIAAIRSGKFSPGERLPNEREMAATFSTTRPIIRDALLILHKDGYIERKVGSGTYISDNVPQLIEMADAEVDITTRYEHDFQETIEARLLFEPGIAAMAARNPTPSLISDMETCLVKILEAPNWLIYKEQIYKFSRCYYVAAGNDFLLWTFDQIVKARQQYKFDGKRATEPVAEIVRRHAHDQLFLIYDAIKSGNEERTSVEVKRNLLGQATSTGL